MGWMAARDLPKTSMVRTGFSGKYGNVLLFFFCVCITGHTCQNPCLHSERARMHLLCYLLISSEMMFNNAIVCPRTCYLRALFVGQGDKYCTDGWPSPLHFASAILRDDVKHCINLCMQLPRSVPCLLETISNIAWMYTCPCCVSCHVLKRRRWANTNVGDDV